ncbi:hypothetical protein BDR26DRAFT_851009 [Obelidium mucronatum]|nr:hypothetical protein BDR26DRAFT_851009 [Obelidium mucronatum]
MNNFLITLVVLFGVFEACCQASGNISVTDVLLANGHVCGSQTKPPKPAHLLCSSGNCKFIPKNVFNTPNNATFQDYICAPPTVLAKSGSSGSQNPSSAVDKLLDLGQPCGSPGSPSKPQSQVCKSGHCILTASNVVKNNAKSEDYTCAAKASTSSFGALNSLCDGKHPCANGLTCIASKCQNVLINVKGYGLGVSCAGDITGCDKGLQCLYVNPGTGSVTRIPGSLKPKCMLKPVTKAGAACDPSTQPCSDDSFLCWATGGAKKLITGYKCLKRDGQACIGGGDCQSGVCVRNTRFGRTSMCVKKIGGGGPGFSIGKVNSATASTTTNATTAAANSTTKLTTMKESTIKETNNSTMQALKVINGTFEGNSTVEGLRRL